MLPFLHGQRSCLRRWLVVFLICWAPFAGHALTSATLTWDANPITETNLAGYKLYYGTASRVYTNVTTLGKVTTASVANLVEGRNYYFAVTAYDDRGLESDYSAEAILDNVKPLVAITSPSANLRITNNSLTVLGTASDNVAVREVLCRVGANPFQPATGITAWSATTPLAPGVNVFQAKSVDTTGNESLVVTRYITNVVGAILTVSTTGNGSVTPNYNGQWLEIGGSYTITAQPAVGFAFTNWTGSIPSTAAQLTFVMQSNLTLVANFVDVARPTLIVTAPLNNAVVTNSTLLAQGTATDNLGVTQVFYRLNGGPFLPAIGTATWSALINLVPGTNFLAFKSIDLLGNESTLVSQVVTYIVRAPISITTQGSGTVTPNLNGQWLDVGRAYTITATPAAGNAFSNWSGSLSATTAQLTFVMQSNLTLVANFYDNSNPLVAITSPSANLRITNNSITVSGTASDNVGVSQVLWRVAANPFQPASGTTAWSATTPLAPGVNAFQAKSVDATGNESSVVTRYITNVVGAILTVSTTGNGSVSPNYNGQWLEIGSSYTITAQPAVGFAFSNWTGSIPSTAAQLTFVMQSNLTLVANFFDNSNPLVTITSPSANLRITNNSITISGTASDNAAVTQVLYRMGSDPFQPATGTTTWSTTVPLVAGANAFQVKSRDAAGNESLLATRYITNIVGAILTVSTTGNGSVTPNYNGQWLEIGSSYTITAQPAVGFAFSNWTGSIPSTAAQLTFVMQSNLTLVANFFDNSNPLVTITSPSANLRITNNSITISGTASDNAAVTQVLYRMGSNPFQPASGTTTWSTTVPLVAGANAFQVKSRDAAGNESPLATRYVTNIVGAILTVSTTGNGSVSPNYNGQWLEIGGTYTITAQPAVGFAFTNWTGSIPSTAAQLTFVMQSNLTLVANFVDVARPTLTVTAPVNNSVVTNSTLLAQGTATDNLGVTQVRYQHNGGAFQPATGTTAWSALLTLVPGTNYFTFKAVDLAGNESTLVSQVVTYIVRAPVSITTQGSGTITPNYDGQWLDVGRAYTITASPAPGNAFSNWSGSLSATTAQLTFVMQPDLTLVANFYDNSNPLLAITSPSANLRITNDSITISGTASDNVGVSQVLWRVAADPFQPASGTTAWSATIPLAPGVNAFQAKSVDTTGNESLVVTRYITNVVGAVLTVSTTGNGTITPNYNGQWLEIGRSYTVTAQPAVGFVFTNWTGSVPGTAAQLTFVMQSGLTLVANFVDALKPTVAVTSPAPNSTVTNSSVTLQGTATDNGGVSQVLHSEDGGPFQPANGTTSWTASLTLYNKTNFVRVKSIDTVGNESVVVSHMIIYSHKGGMKLGKRGKGSVYPDLNNQMLEVGNGYSILATPTPGYRFSDWSGSLSSTNPQLTFLFQTNFDITATFVDATKPTVMVLSPLPNTRVTNGLVNFTGNATDNEGVSQVWCSLNNGPFEIVNGTSNWTTSVNLPAGPNTLRFKSVDVTGLESPVVAHTVTSVAMSPISISANGRGTVSPANGSFLEIGKVYTAMATPALGYVLTNWSGSIFTNSSLFSFVMQSNLTLTANFVDVSKPLLTIVSPMLNARLTNNIITMQGRVTDNGVVAQVLYELNGAPVEIASGTTNFAAPLTLRAGVNSLRAWAVDATGNQSLVVSQAVTYVVMHPISMSIVGKGTVSPVNGQWLEVGKPYNALATPALGYALTNWSGSIFTNRSSFSFVMQSNLTLTATFVDVSKPLLTIVSPMLNARLTNNLITMQGRVTDNGTVAQVLYELNGAPVEIASGTTNFAASLVLRAGPNSLRAWAIDTAGNQSLVVSQAVTYVVMHPIAMSIVGRGTVTPVNGQWLEVGKPYNALATPALGYVLTNWSGSIFTNRSSFSFVMQSNLAFTATFVDVSKPLLTIVSPMLNARLTNNIVTMQGRVTDNGVVAQVLYELNGAPVEIASGTTNFAASLVLRAGPNSLRAWAIDTAGNQSLVVSQAVTYVVMHPISMSIVGKGTVSPANGQWLEVGKPYNALATAAVGFGLTNWSGSIFTNRANFTFIMQSNFTLTANFVDVMKPTVSIMAPMLNARLTNSSVIFQGTSSDNLSVAQVLYGLNSGPWQVASGTTNWVTSIDLAAGPNKLRVKAVDVTGWESTTLTQTVTYVVMSPLVLTTSGNGTVAPNMNGQLLEVGKSYTIIATPGVGHLLSNWVGSVYSESATLTFVMGTNYNLRAQFEPNPFVPAKGDYNGLFFETSGVLHDSSGFLKLSVTDRGSFSASLIAAGQSIPFSGAFNLSGRASPIVARTGKPPLVFDLQLDMANSTHQVTGTVSDGTWTADYTADRSLWNTTANPFKGQYSIVLPGATSSETAPGGFSYGTVMVDAMGNLTLSGSAGDGQMLSQTVPISQNGEWPLYVPLYAGKGSILSWLTFTNQGGEPLHGLVSWIKSPQSATHYPAGFDQELVAASSRFVPPTPGTTNKVANLGLIRVIASEGNLTVPVTNYVELTWANTIWNTNSSANFTLALNNYNGLVSGVFRVPGTSIMRSYSGILLQNRDAGWGYFMGTNQSGQVRIEAGP